MITLAILFSILAAPTLDVSIAPDQPVPYVYADDPVILQIKSDADGKASGQVSITSDSGASLVVALADIPLRANGAHWQPLDGAPKEMGRYRAHVVLDTGGGHLETELSYCRIARPNGEIALPLRLSMGSDDAMLLHAARGVPVQRVTVGASSANAAVAGNGLRVTIAADLKTINDPAALGVLVDGANDKIEAWRITMPSEGMAAVDPAVAALRQTGNRAGVEILLAPGVNVSELFANGLGRIASGLVVRATEYDDSERMLLRASAERAGYESLPLTLGFALDSSDTGGTSIQNVLAGLDDRIACEIDTESLYANGAFAEGYPMLSAIAHRLSGQQYAGEYGTPNAVCGRIFRSADNWTVILWTKNVASEHPLIVGDASELAAYDAWNNPLPTPPVVSSAARVAVGKLPVFISGKGGSLLAVNARLSARREAELFVKDRWLQQDIPKEVNDMLKPIATNGFSRTDRVTFFALLRTFPVLEQKWHDGTMRRDVAVPAMASLSRLTRNLCILEQDSGEPFIELLQETLARCGEYQSQYLTSTGGSDVKHERAEWLLAEVARLTAEAKSLAEADRGIEAVGVASLAEWRARSLEFALNADPLGAPEPPRVAPVVKPKAEPKPSVKKQSTKRKR